MNFASFWRRAPLTMFCSTLCVLALAPDASALSRRDQGNIDVLNRNMAAAEARYRQALVKIGNNDPDGQKEGDAALEDMEDSVAACGQQKGCQVSTLLTTYKRLLKLNADSESPEGDDPEIDPNDPDPTMPAMSHSVPPCRRPPRRRACWTAIRTGSTRWCSTTPRCRPAFAAG
jgi:membrane-bound lytic murein transglycosylase D